MSYIKVLSIIRYKSKLVLPFIRYTSKLVLTNDEMNDLTNYVTNPLSGKKIYYNKNINEDDLIEGIVKNYSV